MGFFYQALKKESGLATDTQIEAEAGLALAGTATAVGAATDEPAKIAASVRTTAKQKFELKHPIEGLVAFLVPPVMDESIVAMEQCRILRTRVRDLMHNKGMRTLLMTSAMPAEGKTLLSVNLAFAMSHIENARVLLVDADLRRPSVARFLKMNPDRGLNSFLTGQHGFDDICWSLTPSLDLVPTCEVEDNSAEMLHGQQMQEFIRTVRDRYDFILFDGPPLFPIVDAQVLGPLVDGAILVVRANKTPFDLSRQAADILKSKFIGTVLNGADHMAHAGYYGGYYGKYGSKGKK